MASSLLGGLFGNIEAEASKLFSGVAASVGTSAAKAVSANPTVQGALEDLQARLDRAQTATLIAGGVAAVVVLFYYVPRFESPLKVLSKRKRR